MTPLLSLVAGGGDKEDAGADDEAAEVRERELVLVPEAEEIRGYEQHHGLGSLESGRMAADTTVTTKDGNGYQKPDYPMGFTR